MEATTTQGRSADVLEELGFQLVKRDKWLDLTRCRFCGNWDGQILSYQSGSELSRVNLCDQCGGQWRRN
jgi:hypothetical protein